MAMWNIYRKQSFLMRLTNEKSNPELNEIAEANKN